MKMGVVKGEASDKETQKIDAAVKTDGEGVRRLDPDTMNQWARLAAATDQGGYRKAARISTVPFRWPRPAISFAGALALVIIAGWFVLNRASTMTYETARREQSTVTLGDSTEVMLNHTSELIVERRPFDKTRRVGLKGEAFFRVLRNGAPFVVSTEVGTVRVLGTEFNVLARGDRMEVAVVRGIVEVSVKRDEVARSVTLGTGEMTFVSEDGSPLLPWKIPFADYPGWIYSKFNFQQTTFPDACKELESRFDIVIKLEDPQLRNETVTGVLDGHSVESALAALCALAGKDYRYENQVYVVY
ncbi:MAG: FecR domain-containing protein [Ignavibacteria bacterium]|nr:FecR domain-containing protein [Ignavibacteria bacterium]